MGGEEKRELNTNNPRRNGTLDTVLLLDCAGGLSSLGILLFGEFEVAFALFGGLNLWL